MPKVFFAVLFSAGMLLLGTERADAQHVYVKVVPHETVVRRPAPPSPKHVWIGAEWRDRGGRYEEVPGHWEMPPHGHKAWVPGHWVREPRGSYWVAGHWR